VTYDYQFAKVTKEFELITDLSSAKIVGKTARQVFPCFNECWSEVSKTLSLVGDTVQFKQFFRHESEYFQIFMFRYSPEQIIMLFTEIVSQAIPKDVLQIHQILFDNAQDIVLYVREDGQIVDANQCACKKYGYSKQELLP
jgi:PAS domain-containing protein